MAGQSDYCRCEPHLRFVVCRRRSGDIATRSQNPQERSHHAVFHQLFAVSAPFARSVAIAALMGATMLAGPLTAARAASAANAPIQLAQAAAPQNRAATRASQTRGETVEQRIADLHTALQITPDQDSKWNDVAQAMRENAAAMDKLIAPNRETPPQNMTAVEDLEAYQKFAQAHVDGLKNLISSFKVLYAAMPDARKKITGEVFNTSGRERASIWCR
jgi:protein CpxP